MAKKADEPKELPRQEVVARIIPYFAVVVDGGDDRVVQALRANTYIGATAEKALVALKSDLILRYRDRYRTALKVANPELINATSWREPIE